MMRRILSLVLGLLTLTACLTAGAEETAEKYDSMPEILEMSVQESERYLGEKQSLVYKEYLVTANEDVNAELAALADELEARVLPNVELAKKKNSWKGRSMLNTVVVWYRTGDRFVSTLTEACYEHNQEQVQIETASRTYDLSTGDRILLTDLFAPDSAAWDILAEGVRSTLESLYPELDRDDAAIDTLCSREQLEQADFTLSGMELTLHYHCSLVFPELTNLMRVRFLYPQFEGMTTELGAQAMDNSRWKMVAVTCDDGPKDYASSKALDAFRKTGSRATYFIVGKQLETYDYVFIRQQDQNFLFGNHTWSHYGISKKVTKEARLKQFNKMNDAARKLVGENARYFRCPGGTYNNWVSAGIEAPIIQWSLDTKDFTGKSAEVIAQIVEENVQDGDIILVHDTGKHEHEAILSYAPWLEEHGYMLVTLDELAAAWGVEPQNGEIYWSFRPGDCESDRTGG